MRIIALSLLLAGSALAHRVHSLQITVLSTMLADEGIGEWGFSALVEVDGKTLLFDTGARPETVLQNARELKLDLSKTQDVVLSHNHGDHTGGLVTLRRAMMKEHPDALSRAHVGRGAFWSRPSKDGEGNQLLVDRAAYEATGARFIGHDAAVELLPGVWLTGPIPRPNPERNWSDLGKVQSPAGLIEDNVPEDQALIFDTDQGLVLLSGCGHAGVINTIEFARKVVRSAPLHAAVGGFHLFPADDAKLAWTIGKLRQYGLQQLLGAHCTGLEAVYRIRQDAGLDRKHCLVGAVGATFKLGAGINPLRVAR
jgi:7,8-dihydropterin-6-yl-methyl-4-(beta-D-ribofuranosyl)aminobenzene 5'-phosphate synthase